MASRWRAWLKRLTRPHALGRRGERLAARHLKRAGLKILARGWRGRAGEIDLIAREGRYTVFVEVKTRRAVAGNRPEEAVGRRKQRTIVKLAGEWAAAQARRGMDRAAIAVRFDVVAVVWPEGGRPQVKHIRGAFDASGMGFV